MTKKEEVEKLGKQYDLWQVEYERVCDRCEELEIRLSVEREHIGMIRQKMSLLSRQIFLCRDYALIFVFHVLAKVL